MFRGAPALCPLPFFSFTGARGILFCKKFMAAASGNSLRYCSHAADKAAYERAGYGPHRDPLKPAQGSALMCAQVINLAVGDDLRASRSESGSQ